MEAYDPGHFRLEWKLMILEIFLKLKQGPLCCPNGLPMKAYCSFLKETLH